ncbi:hypothetical protein BJX99DRAFT_240999 [Aspergillus californicus]
MEDDGYATRPGMGKFRFKAKPKSSSRSGPSKGHGRDGPGHTQPSHEPLRIHKDKGRRSRSSTTEPVNLDSHSLSPNAAFRECLFDAMADEEGAAYWESVFGQPLHKFGSSVDAWNAEEFSEYVRGELWKKTRDGKIEEYERLKTERKRKVQADSENIKLEKERESRSKAEEAFRQKSNKQEEKRRLEVYWTNAWDTYLMSWAEIEHMREDEAALAAQGLDSKENIDIRNLLAYPVSSGKEKDISKHNIGEFMLHAPRLSPLVGRTTAAPEPIKTYVLQTLKTERIRWHPDKIQHRYGASFGVNESLMKSVTRVFQIIDGLYQDML